MLKNGYKVKILNTINFKKSMHYNPFSYVQSEKDILKLVTTLMTNTKGEGSGGDPFWEKSERLLLTALIAYLHYEAPVEEQNFATLLEMLNTMQVMEDDEEYQNPVDLLFEDLAKTKPNSFAGRQYKLYKLAAGKTAKSILISCGARLAPFDIQELRDLTMYDELELDTLGDKKTALFLIMSDTDSTFNFLISMVYTQLFNLLCDKADDVYGGKLPIHVRCLIDECANIGQIPNLEKLVATIRSREISACLVLQTKSQLKAIYKDNADTIIGNMDSQIFLGGSEPGTLKDLSELLGKETIDAFNTSDTRGNSPSYGTTFQKMGHELLSRDELAVLDGGKCILQLRGVRPFLSDKYDLTQHPNYKLTSDYDPKNTFDIEKYLNRKVAVSPALKAHGISGRARLFEVVQRVQEVNALRAHRNRVREFAGEALDSRDLQRHPDWKLGYLVAPPRMAHYMACSARIYSTYLKYVAPEDIHAYSIDEVFLDVTDYPYDCTAHELAQTIIRDVLETTGITATAGIGTNLFLAKVAMDIVAKHIPADENGVRNE